MNLPPQLGKGDEMSVIYSGVVSSLDSQVLRELMIVTDRFTENTTLSTLSWYGDYETRRIVYACLQAVSAAYPNTRIMHTCSSEMDVEHETSEVWQAGKYLFQVNLLTPEQSEITVTTDVRSFAQTDPATDRTIFLERVHEFPGLGKQRINCPACGSEYIHLENCEVYKQGRGTTIEIVYYCEAQHRFSVCQQFHKGHVFVRTTLLGIKRNDDEMWRD